MIILDSHCSPSRSLSCSRSRYLSHSLSFKMVSFTLTVATADADGQRQGHGPHNMVGRDRLWCRKCTDPLALRVALCFCLRWCVVHCLVLPRTVTHVERPCAGISNDPLPHSIPLTMSLPSRPQDTSLVVRYGQRIVARIAAIRLGAWARRIVVAVATGVVDHAHRIVVDRSAR